MSTLLSKLFAHVCRAFPPPKELKMTENARVGSFLVAKLFRYGARTYLKGYN